MSFARLDGIDEVGANNPDRPTQARPRRGAASLACTSDASSVGNFAPAANADADDVVNSKPRKPFLLVLEPLEVYGSLATAIGCAVLWRCARTEFLRTVGMAAFGIFAYNIVNNCVGCYVGRGFFTRQLRCRLIRSRHRLLHGLTYGVYYAWLPALAYGLCLAAAARMSKHTAAQLVCPTFAMLAAAFALVIPTLASSSGHTKSEREETVGRMNEHAYGCVFVGCVGTLLYLFASAFNL
ncbi:Hypothetical protein UVM_LOCUS443 [uncultured virus]|nr:Hypothetical protein UVM_LOCUS443 [uncultured virus]